jgi:hypothetical protein
MINRHMMKTPIRVPTTSPKENCSIPTTVLLVTTSAAGEITLEGVKFFDRFLSYRGEKKMRIGGGTCHLELLYCPGAVR